MLSILSTSFVGIIVFAVMDYIFLAHIAKDFYLTKLASHITTQNGSLVPYTPAVPLVYLGAVLAIWIFVLNHQVTLGGAMLYGGMLGFFMYAFYDFTNLATFKEYPWSLVIVDIIWGTVLVSLVTGVMWYIKSFFA